MPKQVLYLPEWNYIKIETYWNVNAEASALSSRMELY